jgi:hypothetical protein
LSYYLVECTDFDFFDKNDHNTPDMDAKWN